MHYYPLNYSQLNFIEGSYNPSMVKSMNNKTFVFWERALFQRACSVLQFELPEEWQGSVKDFFLYCLFRFGYVGVFKTAEFGTVFQPGALNGQNFYYQPTTLQVSNPLYNNDLTIGSNCELIKLTPDYSGIWGYYFILC